MISHADISKEVILLIKKKLNYIIIQKTDIKWPLRCDLTPLDFFYKIFLKFMLIIEK